MLEWIQNKSLMPYIEFSTLLQQLSTSAHEVRSCAVILRTPYFISTLRRHVDRIHAEFCSRRDLISLAEVWPGTKTAISWYHCLGLSRGCRLSTMCAVPSVPLIFLLICELNMLPIYRHKVKNVVIMKYSTPAQFVFLLYALSVWRTFWMRM